MMISTKKLLKLAKNWQRIASLNRKRITSGQIKFGSTNSNSSSTTSEAEKCHFVVYSVDQKRFLLPLEYLNSEIIRELFDMAEDEFGLSSDGTLPCEAELLKYAISLIKQQVNKDVEKTMLTSIARNCYSYQVTSQQMTILGY